jgi:hypothetical protein
MHEVELTYFKQSGKSYTSDSYISEKSSLLDIWEEVREMIRNKNLPGLIEGADEFIVLINVPYHTHNYPHLFNIK